MHRFVMKYTLLFDGLNELSTSEFEKSFVDNGFRSSCGNAQLDPWAKLPILRKPIDLFVYSWLGYSMGWGPFTVTIGMRPLCFP